jgi:hypothetical protein
MSHAARPHPVLQPTFRFRSYPIHNCTSAQRTPRPVRCIITAAAAAIGCITELSDCRYGMCDQADAKSRPAGGGCCRSVYLAQLNMSPSIASVLFTASCTAVSIGVTILSVHSNAFPIVAAASATVRTTFRIYVCTTRLLCALIFTGHIHLMPDSLKAFGTGRET